MGNKDYIPYNDVQFLEWAKNVYAYMLMRFSGWSIPDPRPSLEAPLAAFGTALAKLGDPNYGKVDMERKKDARKVCGKVFRVYVQSYLARNPTVSDEDRVAMGLPVYKTTKSRQPPPMTVPGLEVDTGTPRRHRVHYRNRGNNRWGKPDGVAVIKIHWAILDHYPTNIEELVRSDYATASPWVNDFSEKDRGKRVYYCGCWEATAKGGKGPFGEIVEAIVP
ncbi:MAG: hypothetical protein LBD79_04710 [Treponema sp.]|jgi:hypothetical protein|nr:hypothetical protein [Treponema sp.]